MMSAKRSRMPLVLMLRICGVHRPRPRSVVDVDVDALTSVIFQAQGGDEKI